jgi:hypothetical protein
MLKNLITFTALAGVLSLTHIGQSQALPTAGARNQFQVGGGWSYAEPDYGQKSIQGLTAYADYDFASHIGVEAEFHAISLVTPTDLGENSFLIGPRFTLRRKRLNFYAKGLFGLGNIDIQEVADNPEGGAGTYFAYGIGGGLDIQATRHINVRAVDVEYQHWNYQSGLTPTVLTFGAAYRFR